MQVKGLCCSASEQSLPFWNAWIWQAVFLLSQCAAACWHWQGAPIQSTPTSAHPPAHLGLVVWKLTFCTVTNSVPDTNTPFVESMMCTCGSHQPRPGGLQNSVWTTAHV